MELDAVKPGGIGRREVEAYMVGRGPTTHLGLQVGAVVVQHDVQRLATRVTAADPLEERQELDPGLAGEESAVEPIGLQVLD